MKEKIKELGYWLEDKLKDLCGEITPDKRLGVTLAMLLLFTVLNLYFTFTAVSNWGRDQQRKEQLRIEHIEGLELRKKKRLEDLIDSEIEPWQGDSIFYNPKNNKA